MCLTVAAWLYSSGAKIAKKHKCRFRMVSLGFCSAESDPVVHLPDFSTLNAQSTRDGARPRPTHSPWCTGGLPACHAAESARKDPRPQDKRSFVFRKKGQFHTCMCMYKFFAAYVARSRRGSEMHDTQTHAENIPGVLLCSVNIIKYYYIVQKAIRIVCSRYLIYLTPPGR